MNIIFEPTKGIINTCDLIDEGIENFLRSRDNQRLGKFEYEIEGLINIFHIIRIFESILELARKDLVFIQSAFILSRTIFETAIKVGWIFQPKNTFENESRYVAQLNTESELWAKWIKEIENISGNVEDLKSSKHGFDDFKNELSSLLEDHGQKVPKLPNMREILKSLGKEEQYKSYILLSQFTHMTHYAGSIYRRHLGIDKQMSEEVKLSDWKFVFNVCWQLFESVSELYMLKTEQRENLFKNKFKAAVRKSIAEIA